MSPGIAAAVFLVSLTASLVAAALFAERLDRLGEHLGLPEGVIGLLTAAGADAPELASAVVALASGASGAGFGVVVGASVFNIATMLGISALVAGAVVVDRGNVVLEGLVAAVVTVAVLLFGVGAIPAWALVVLCAAVVAPYVTLLARGPRGERVDTPHELSRTLLEIPPAVGVIVLGSIGMVRAALDLADRAGVSEVVVGTLLLAGLASLPNAFTGIRLGRRGRGDALYSETMSSNTINLVGGVAVPALVVSFGARFSHLAIADLIWLLAATVAAMLLLGRTGRMGRGGAAALIASWLGFAVVQGVFG
ncbi:MAG: sodium:calcium antiporter [Gaiellaceae bacterium]